MFPNSKVSDEKIEVSKVENQVVHQDNPVQFIAKVPYIQTDDFGNEVTFYRKEYLTVENLEAQKKNLQDQMDILDAKLAQIEAVK